MVSWIIHPLVVLSDHEDRLMCSDVTCATDKRSVEGGVCVMSIRQRGLDAVSSRDVGCVLSDK